MSTNKFTSSTTTKRAAYKRQQRQLAERRRQLRAELLAREDGDGFWADLANTLTN